MQKLEKEEKLFGTPAVTNAWVSAIAHHPMAYLEHRSAFMWNFLAGSESTMWLIDIEDTTKIPFPDRPAFVAVKNIHDALKPTPFFRAGNGCCSALRFARLAGAGVSGRKGLISIGVCGSAAVYVLTFYAVGVASDFRYAYWAVLASLTGVVIAAAGALRRRSAKTVPSSAA